MLEAEPGDLAQEERAKVEGCDPPGQAVTSRLDAQGGASRYHYVHRMMVHQALDLRRPVGEILSLIEEQVGRPSGVSRLVERRPQDPILEPPHDRKNRVADRPQAVEIIELHAEDAPRLDALLADQVLDDLLEQRRLANLARAPQHDGGSEPGLELSKEGFECPTTIRRKNSARLSLPPRVGAAELVVEPCRQAHSVEKVLSTEIGHGRS